QPATGSPETPATGPRDAQGNDPGCECHMFKRIAAWFKRSSAGVAPATIRRCECCPSPQVLHITEVQQGEVESERHLCEACAQVIWSVPPRPNSLLVRTSRRESEEVRMEIARVIISEKHEQQVLSLREAEGERIFSYMLGIFEVTAI